MSDIKEFKQREKLAKKEYNRLDSILQKLKERYQPSSTRTREQWDAILYASDEAMNAWHNWKQFESIEQKNKR